MDLTKLNELQTQLGQGIAGAVSKLDWTRVEATYRELNKVGETDRMTVHLRDGGREAVKFPSILLSDLGEARDYMAEPGKGTWYSVNITLTRDGDISLDFNYDTQPTWNLDRDDEEYELDNKLHPRAADKLPDWHPSKATTA